MPRTSTRDKERGTREERIPVGVPRQTGNLTPEMHAKLKGLVPRWVNDDGEKLNMFQLGGYKFIEKDAGIVAGDTGIASDNSGIDNRVSRLVDKKTGMRAYLMAIPEKFYKQDQKAKRKIREERFQSIKKGEGLVGQGFLPPEPGDIDL